MTLKDYRKFIILKFKKLINIYCLTESSALEWMKKEITMENKNVSISKARYGWLNFRNTMIHIYISLSN